MKNCKRIFAIILIIAIAIQGVFSVAIIANAGNIGNVVTRETDGGGGTVPRQKTITYSIKFKVESDSSDSVFVYAITKNPNEQTYRTSITYDKFNRNRTYYDLTDFVDNNTLMSSLYGVMNDNGGLVNTEASIGTNNVPYKNFAEGIINLGKHVAEANNAKKTDGNTIIWDEDGNDDDPIVPWGPFTDGDHFSTVLNVYDIDSNQLDALNGLYYVKSDGTKQYLKDYFSLNSTLIKEYEKYYKTDASVAKIFTRTETEIGYNSTNKTYTFVSGIYKYDIDTINETIKVTNILDSSNYQVNISEGGQYDFESSADGTNAPEIRKNTVQLLNEKFGLSLDSDDNKSITGLKIGGNTITYAYNSCTTGNSSNTKYAVFYKGSDGEQYFSFLDYVGTIDFDNTKDTKRIKVINSEQLSFTDARQKIEEETATTGGTTTGETEIEPAVTTANGYSYKLIKTPDKDVYIKVFKGTEAGSTEVYYIDFNSTYHLTVEESSGDTSENKNYFSRGSEVSRGSYENDFKTLAQDGSIYSVYRYPYGEYANDGKFTNDIIYDTTKTVYLDLSTTIQAKSKTDANKIDKVQTDTNLVSINMTDYLKNYRIEKDTATDDDSKDDGITYDTWGGIHRAGNFTENEQAIETKIMDYAIPLFAFIVFLAVIILGFKAMGNATKDNPKERVVLMDSFKNIFIGVIIVGFAIGIGTIAFSALSQTVFNIYGVNLQSEQVARDITTDTKEAEKDKATNFLVQFLADAITSLINGFRQLLHALLDYDSIENTVFLGHIKDDNGAVSLSTISNEDLLYPFMNQEFKGISMKTVNKLDLYDEIYWAFTLISIPIMLLAILKMGFNYVIHSSNYSQIAEVKDDARRFLMALLFIALGPYIFRLIIMFFNLMTLLLPVDFSWGGIMYQINNGTIIGAVVGGIWFLWIELQIAFTFIVREIMLTVMYILTPFVALMWALSSKFRLMKIWWGEVISNASMQFVYAIVFFIATIGMSVMGGSWMISLVWMSMVIKLSKVLRDSLQNDFFMAKSGIDEEGIAGELTQKTRAMTTSRAWQGVKGLAGSKMEDKYIGYQLEHNLNGDDKKGNAWKTARGLAHVLQGKGNFEDFGNEGTKQIQALRLKKEQEANAIDNAATGLTGIYRNQFALGDEIIKEGLRREGALGMDGKPLENQAKLKAPIKILRAKYDAPEDGKGSHSYYMNGIKGGNLDDKQFETYQNGLKDGTYKNLHEYLGKTGQLPKEEQFQFDAIAEKLAKREQGTPQGGVGQDTGGNLPGGSNQPSGGGLPGGSNQPLPSSGGSNGGGGSLPTRTSEQYFDDFRTQMGVAGLSGSNYDYMQDLESQIQSAKHDSNLDPSTAGSNKTKIDQLTKQRNALLDSASQDKACKIGEQIRNLESKKASCENALANDKSEDSQRINSEELKRINKELYGSEDGKDKSGGLHGELNNTDSVKAGKEITRLENEVKSRQEQLKQAEEDIKKANLNHADSSSLLEKKASLEAGIKEHQGKLEKTKKANPIAFKNPEELYKPRTVDIINGLKEAKKKK